MQTVYKYSPLIESFFIKPTIKLSNSQLLNDPFESIASEEICGSLIKIATESGIKISFPLSETSQTVNDFIMFNGIVSFSETQRNLLMWAHYANQHTGMCVGFDSMLFNDIPDEPRLNVDITIRTPAKINYDNYRDLENGLVTSNPLREAITHHLLKKSNDWLFEKEHRSIIPMHNSDSFVLSGNPNSKIFLQGKTTNTILSDMIKLYLIENKIKKIDENTFEFIKDAMELLEYSIFAGSRNVSMLKNINEKYIKSIYFGCRSSSEKIESAYNNIKNNDNFKHVEIYHYTLDKSRFELNRNIVSEDYIINLKEKNEY
ncbi:DUF2971 domain-containing protein [Aeromonas sanarellii]|uniref:DUF2971 domain-containing protein n=1 Tax=Aeromonas sanarellii TaxID=633415 RepID=UPI00399F57F7